MAETTSSSDEKLASTPPHNEKASSTSARTPSSLDLNETSENTTFDEAATKKLLRKLDWNIVPFLTFLYLLAFIDRTNIGNARLAGLEKDLGMMGLDFNTALSIFTPFYMASEIPSNIGMKRTRPSLWLSLIMLGWGISMTFMGIVTNFAGLLATRALLGLFEGGLFPGVMFYMTMWYRRTEVGYRMGLFYSAATLAGAFGGLLARAIINMDGVGGKSGWCWIFILEGLVTVVASISAYWILSDYPETARFLTPTEKVEVQRRLKLDRSSLADEYDIKYFWQAVKDWKIYMNMFITLGIYTPLYSFSQFLPTIVESMGFADANDVQLLTVPPYVFACFTTILSGYLADRFKQRGIFLIVNCFMGIIGFTMLISTRIPGVQYLGTFLAAGGIYPNVAMGVAWTGNNIGGSTKRAVGIAMQVMWGSAGGAIAAFTYRTQDAPRYFLGHGILIGTLSMSIVLSLIMTVWFRKENRRRDLLLAEKGLTVDELTDEMKAAEREMGDDATFFRYVV